MSFRIRLAIVGAVAAAATMVAAGTGLGSSAMTRVGAVVVPAHAAVQPTYVDVTDSFRSDAGWGVAHGLVVAAGRAPAAAVTDRVPSGADRPAAVAGAVVAGPAMVSDRSALLDAELGRAGLIPAPGCAGAACGVDGCGFLAPGCALLDCSLLNPACGLGVPVSSCGFFAPVCGLDGLGGFREDREFLDRHLRFHDLADRHSDHRSRRSDRR